MPVTINGSGGFTANDGSAAAPSIAGTDSNTGVFFPAADTVAIATGGTERVRVNGSGDFQFNSGYGSVATAYACRAWVNFNGVGTVSITASGNCSSITDNGVGDYTVNFANALVDANYNFVTNSSNTTSANILCIAQLNWDNPTKSTTALRLYNLKSNTGALTDQNTISVSIFR